LASTLAADTPRKVITVGDSITVGASVSNQFLDRSYPIQLGELLGDGYVVENYGVSGSASMKSSWFSYWDTDNYKKALESNPDIVIIQHGTNDAQWVNWNWSENSNFVTFQKNYIELVDSFRDLPSQPVIYLSIPPPIYKDTLHSVYQPEFMNSEHKINDLYPALIPHMNKQTIKLPEG